MNTARQCYSLRVRTTIELDDDTAAAVQRLRREGNRGASEAVNDLIRRGMLETERPEPFVPVSKPLGIKIDVSNVAEALDHLEGPTAR